MEQIKNKFDYIIYRSLQFKPTLETTLNNLLQFFSDTEISDNNIELKISHLIKYLKAHKCLIILDDIQDIFTPQKFSGEYQIGYENYRVFFEKIADNNHQSCLLLNSDEKLRELANLEYNNNYVKSLVLSGLEMEGAKNICQDYNLSNPENWETLIKIYQGNPSWLKLTANEINELFKGNIKEFLSYQQPVLCECLQTELEQQFKRLTNYEKTVINLLTNNSEAMTLSDFKNEMKLSPSDLLNAILSLNRRFLIKMKEEESVTKYGLNCIIKEYSSRSKY